MAKKITNLDVIQSVLWKVLECGGSQIINFIITVILARLLIPEDYGTISLITIFVNLANVIVQRGFNTALIQKKDVDEIDFSTSFYISIFIAVILYILIFIGSPYIAKFYGKLELINILRVLAITLFLGAFNSIQVAIISRNMEFKKLFYSTLGGMIFSGIVAISMAYLNFGVWSLVFQQLTNQFMTSIIMCFTVKWVPKSIFSFNRLKQLLNYGWKILASNLITTLFINISDLIVGKKYGVNSLAYFNRGKQFPMLIFTVIDTSIQSVMLPTFSLEQDDRKKVKDMFRRTLTTSCFIIFPIMIGLFVTAKPLITILLSEKWLDSVPFMQIYCLTYMFLPIHTANLQVIQALGYSDIILKLEILKKIVEITILLISIKYGIYAMSIGTFISSIISLGINLYPNTKILEYRYKEQLRDIFPIIVASVFMGVIVHIISLLNMNILVTFVLQVFVGIVSYITLVNILKIESYMYLINVLNKLIFSRSRNILN